MRATWTASAHSVSPVTPDETTKLLTAVAGVLSGLGGIGALAKLRNPYRHVRNALEVRKMFKEADADPRVWDAVVIAELTQVSHPAWRAIYALLTMFGIVAGVAAAGSLITAAIAEKQHNAAWRSIYEVWSVVLVVAFFIWLLAAITWGVRASRELNGPYHGLSTRFEAEPWLTLESPSPVIPPVRRGATRMHRPSRRALRSLRRRPQPPPPTAPLPPR